MVVCERYVKAKVGKKVYKGKYSHSFFVILFALIY